MLNDLNIPSLDNRRQLSSIILLYKVIHNLIDISSTDLLPITSTTDIIRDFIIYLPGPANIATPFFQIMELTSTLHSATIFDWIQKPTEITVPAHILNNECWATVLLGWFSY